MPKLALPFVLPLNKTYDNKGTTNNNSIHMMNVGKCRTYLPIPQPKIEMKKKWFWMYACVSYCKLFSKFSKQNTIFQNKQIGTYSFEK